MNERIQIAILYASLCVISIVAVFLTYFFSSFIVLPLISSVIIVGLFAFLWLREKSISEREYQFITIVTHKFRTPLTGIKWAIDAFKKDITQEEKNDILKNMENNSNKLMEIVDLLIGFVKFNQKLEYAFEASSLHEMIQESIEKYSQRIREKNMNFNIKSNPDIPLVVMDRRKIQFVIDMLIDNAVKYTPAGGHINVVVEPRKNIIMVAVEDDGMGIDAPDMKYLFKKFFRSAEAKKIDTEGMGMGLHTAQVIMSHHGGTLKAMSPGKGGGSVFYIELPMTQ